MFKSLTFSALGALHLESDEDEDTFDAVGKEVCERCGDNLEVTLNGAFVHFRETPSTDRFAVLHALMIGYQYNRDMKILANSVKSKDAL